jgi:hypothetical protein
MSTYWWDNATWKTNWLHSREEVLITIKSRREMSYTEQPRVFAFNPASAPLPTLPALPPTAVFPGGEEDADSWLGWLPRPFKRARTAAHAIA